MYWNIYNTKGIPFLGAHRAFTKYNYNLNKNTKKLKTNTYIAQIILPQCKNKQTHTQNSFYSKKK